jgi:hypothetical protein
MNTSELIWCSQNDVVVLRLSENFVCDVLAHHSVIDVLALNNYQFTIGSAEGTDTDYHRCAGTNQRWVNQEGDK